VETTPGDVAQVDFGYVGKLYDPQRHILRRACLFLMVLGHSRHAFARVVFDQRSETWLRLHVEAFERLGGVPATLVPDNLKAAVIRAGFGVDGPTALNRSYRELARHYGFKVDPTPPRSPNKKGKVERGVRYVKTSFFKGRDGEDISEVNTLLDRWVVEIAGQRLHGVTGRRPLEVFEAEERAALRSLPRARFELVVWKKAKVHADCMVSFDRRLYSVPWRLVGREVWVRATPTTVTIYWDDTRVADHSRRGRRSVSIHEAHLPEGRRDFRHRSRGYWVDRARRMGDEVGADIDAVFDADDVLSQLRTAQAMVTHLKKFPPSSSLQAEDPSSGLAHVIVIVGIAGHLRNPALGARVRMTHRSAALSTSSREFSPGYRRGPGVARKARRRGRAHRAFEGAQRHPGATRRDRLTPEW